MRITVAPPMPSRMAGGALAGRQSRHGQAHHDRVVAGQRDVDQHT